MLSDGRAMNSTRTIGEGCARYERARLTFGDELHQLSDFALGRDSQRQRLALPVRGAASLRGHGRTQRYRRGSGFERRSGEPCGSHFGFAFETLAEGSQHWQMDAFVSSAGSRTDPWAKGCLMSRQTLQPDSAYFAVCRPDSHILRVQYRTARGGNTEIYEVLDRPCLQRSVRSPGGAVLRQRRNLLRRTYG